MGIRIYNAAAQAMCDALVDRIDIGGAGTMVLKSGAQPAVNGALSGTTLRTFNLQNPAYGSAAASGTGAVADLNGEPISATTGPAFDLGGAEAPGYVAVVSGGGTTVYTGTIDVAGQGADFTILNKVNALNQQVDIIAPGTFTQRQS